MTTASRRPLLALALGLALGAAACSPSAAEPLDEGADGGATGVVFGLRIKGGKGARLEILAEDGTSVGTFTSGAQVKAIKAQLGEGLYHFAPKGAGKAVGHEPLPFHVYGGKMSYLGDLSFDVTPEGWLFVYGAVDKAEDLGDKATDVDSSLARLSALPKAARRNVVSGYTGKPIDGKSGKAVRAVDPLFRAPASPNPSLPSKPKPIVLDLCLQKERETNPLAYGELTLEVAYVNGTLESLKVTKHKHIYTDALLPCVKRRIKAHKPGVPLGIGYVVQL